MNKLNIVYYFFFAGNSVLQRWRGIKDTFNKFEKKLKDASLIFRKFYGL